MGQNGTKVAVCSIGAEQIARKNIAEPNGWRYFHEFQHVDLWGSPINPEQGFFPDVMIFKGWFVQDYSTLNRHMRLLGDVGFHYNKKCGKAGRIVILWAGSDVLQMGLFYDKMGHYEAKIFQDLRSDRFVHIPVSEDQGQELKRLFGLKPKAPLPTPCRKIFEKLPFSKGPTIAVYMPALRMDFYHFDILYEVAKKMPQMKFIFYHWMFKTPDMERAKPLPNVEYRYPCSREEYEQVIADSWASLRIPDHEGLSGGSAEFLMAGRPVFSCHDMPKWPAKIKRERITPDSIVEVLKDLVPDVPEEVQEHYRHLLDPAKFKERLQARIKATWPELTL